MRKTSIFFVVLMAVVMGSCNKQRVTHRALQKEVDKINAQCPIKGLMGDVTSVGIEGNALVYNIELTTNLLRIDKLKSNTDVMKESVIYDVLSNPDGLKSILASNCDLKFNYKSGSDVMSVLVKAEELRKASDMIKDPEFLARLRLETMVKTTRLQMPMQVDELTLMKDMTIEGKKVCYFYELDNNAITAEMLRNDMAGFKENIKGALNINDPSVAKFVESIAENNMSLCYRYEFPLEKDTVEIDIDLAELKSLILKP